MNWTELSDQEKLLMCAKSAKLSTRRIVSNGESKTSYYVERGGGGDRDIDNVCIMEYCIEDFVNLKETVQAMWSGSVLENLEILSTVVSATAVKYMPEMTKTNMLSERSRNSEDTIIEKVDCEDVDNGDGPPVFVYEF